MDKRRLGRTDIETSSLCLGTMMFGTQLDRAESFRQMDVCIEAGINVFDTAEIYSIPPSAEHQGLSERIVGDWIRERGVRDQIVLATKVSGRSQATYLRAGGTKPVLDAANIEAAIASSLERLQTDYVDLYQVHWPDRSVQLFGADLKGYRHYGPEHVPIEETLGALARLVERGAVRHLGVSNETPWGVMRYLGLSDTAGLPRVVTDQSAYNLLNRKWEMGLAEIAMQEQVQLFAYSPLGQGYISGKYLEGAVPKGSRLDHFGSRMPRYVTPAADAAIRAYLEVAGDFGLDPTAMALRFVETRPWTVSAIFGASNAAQLDVILKSTEIDWTDELEAAVNAVHARYPNPCP